MSVFWLIVGALVGFDVVLAVAWLTTRRTNRTVAKRVRLYTDLTRRW